MKGDKLPSELPEKVQEKMESLGLKGFVQTRRWTMCWYGNHRSHIVRYSVGLDEWACLDHGVTWIRKRKLSKDKAKKKRRRRVAA